MDDARAQLTAVVADAARQIATVLNENPVLDQNPVRGNGPYPLAEVRRQLAEHHAALQRAVQAYPLASHAISQRNGQADGHLAGQVFQVGTRPFGRLGQPPMSLSTRQGLYLQTASCET